MNNMIIKYALCVLAGGGIGTGATYLVMKKKFENKLEKEVEGLRESIEEGYKNRKAKKQNERKTDNDDTKDNEKDYETAKKIADQAREKKDPISIAREISEKNNYVNYSTISDEEDPVIDHDLEIDVPDPDDIEIIAPEEFGELRNYEERTFYYLRDGNLVDENGKIIDEIAKLIGYESLNQFGQYDEPDSVYVRNNREHTDFAIFYRDNETLQSFSG